MRRKNLALRFALGLMLVGLAWGQEEKSAASPKKREPYAELTQAPEKARNRTNPLENDPDAPVAGKKLFERHCMECHGEAGTGTKRAPSLRAAQVQGSSQGTLFWLLTNGVVRSGMPVWSKLPEPRRWQIVSYLKSLGAEAPAGTGATLPPR
jgi:mono/diheme cytochrome c family protein